jgi:nitroreductase
MLTGRPVCRPAILSGVDNELGSPLLAARWSPTGFDAAYDVPAAEVEALLEAARWAPSAGNSQPWAFIVGRRGDDTHERMLRRLAGSSAAWALTASLLVANLAHRYVETLSARSAASPKIHVLDSGVAARLLRLSADKLSRRDPTVLSELGHLLETFVIGELLKQASWADGLTGVGHWRTRDGDEVDLVIEADDGTIVGFEVKAGSRVPGEDFGPLRKLRALTGASFHTGIAVYTGTRSYNFEDRLYAMPIDRLWT